MTTRLAVFLTGATLALSMAAAPALAMDNGAFGTAVTKSDLEGQGYSCDLVSTGFWECTKPGGTTYWCDAGSCQPKPLKTNGGNKLNGVLRHNGGTLMLSH
jgi:hypothetical protein